MSFNVSLYGYCVISLAVFSLCILCYMLRCSNPEFKHSVKELKKKAEEIKGVKEELKER